MAIIIGAIVLCCIEFIIREVFGYGLGLRSASFYIFWALLGGFFGYLIRRIGRQDELHKAVLRELDDLRKKLDLAIQHKVLAVDEQNDVVTAHPVAEIPQVASVVPEGVGEPAPVMPPQTLAPDAATITTSGTVIAPVVDQPDIVISAGTPVQTASEPLRRGKITGKITGKVTGKAVGKIAGKGADQILEQIDTVKKTTKKTTDSPSRIGQLLAEAGNTVLRFVRDFFLRGNLLVKIGGLVFFLGLSFLLSYAASSGLFPVELRYVVAAAVGISLLVFGWRLRERRTAYALILQGLSIGILYLTCFASMKMHGLLPIPLGFGLMVLVCLTAAILAVKQNALGLAVAGSLGGFATPVLLSTGGGSHVALFSYMLILNAGIAFVAWFRAWRVLNLIGFISTFGLFWAWFDRSFRLDHWQSAELFLWAFFVLFVFILLRTSHHLRLLPEEEPQDSQSRSAVLLNTRRRADMIDAALTFALPLAAFGLHLGMSKHMEFAGAFGALCIGAFYLLLTALMRKLWGKSMLLLTEAFLSLGVVFATLAIPLALDSHWTTASWALEAAGIYWVGLRQHRPLARSFAALLLVGAIIGFMRTLALPATVDAPWLAGSALGALLIAATFLFAYLLLTRFAASLASKFEEKYAPWAAVAAIVFFAMLPPLLLSRDNSLPVWALMGILALFLSLRVNLRHGVYAGFMLQFLAGAVFAASMRADQTGAAGLARGWHGLGVALIIGIALLAGYWLVSNDVRRAAREGAPERKLPLFAVFSLIGALIFFNLTPLFVFPLVQILPAWAVSACLALALGLQLEKTSRAVVLFFTIALIVMSSLIFIGQTDFYQMVYDTDLKPFLYRQWLTMLAFSFSGFVSAWSLFRIKVRHPEQAPPLPDGVLFVWGALWWFFAWNMELHRLFDAGMSIALMVCVLSLTELAWLLISRRLQWRTPSLATFSHLPLCAALLIGFIVQGYHPLQHMMGVTWMIAALAHFVILRCHDAENGANHLNIWHMVGLWWLLVLTGSELRWQMASLGGPFSAWPKLGWAIFPLAYLWCAALWRKAASPGGWPLSRYREVYCGSAAFPVAVYMVLWVLFSNVSSSGEALPLPYLPFINPLEIAFVATMLALFFWLRQQPELVGLLRYMPWCIGLLALLCLTGGVFRAVHHLGALPWQFDVLCQSMLLQAGLSVTWGLAAGIMMVVANRNSQRTLWISGIVLMGLVVIKLFIVELSHSNTVERIISFIVVGVLLLGLGYFAPIPPRKTERST